MRVPLYFTLIAAATYGLWWFTVDAVAPDDVNPWQSRLAVVVVLCGLWATAQAASRPRWGRPIFIVALWLVTANYLYLCYLNDASAFWLFGLYITAIAATALLASLPAIAAYGAAVLAASAYLVRGWVWGR